jgi:hypothetical protein
LVIDGKIIPLEWDKSLTSVKIAWKLGPGDYEWVCGRVLGYEKGESVVKAHTNPLFSSNPRGELSPQKFCAIKKLQLMFENTESWLRTLDLNENKRVDQILGFIAEANAKLACGN